MHHEILVCHRRTTDEEIELFIHRATHPLSDPPEPYTLVYPEHLHTSKQAFVRKLISAVPQISALAILVSSPSSPFFNISPHPLLLPPLSSALLQSILAKHAANLQINVKVVTSQRPGEGKTKYIKNATKDSAPITFYSSTDLAQVVRNLNETNGTSLYLAISSPSSFDSHPAVATWAEIDQFLFCLVILGIVTDCHNNIFFTKFGTQVLIEASNGSSSSPPDLRGTFLSLLPPQRVAPPNPASLYGSLSSTWPTTFGVQLKMDSKQHPIETLCAAKFLTTAIQKLGNSQGFTKQQAQFKQLVQKQLLEFVEYYFFQKGTKQVQVVNHPLISIGYDKDTKFRVISTAISTTIHKKGLPHYPLASKTLDELTSFLHILFSKKLPLDPHFVLTSDNLLKLALLRVLISSEIPVIFMGETGSGKTKLVECFGKVSEIPVYTLDMHGGIGEVEIIEFINRVQQKSTGAAILFFDEINTSPAVELMKEIVCDRSCRGVKLQGHFQVLAACNPLVPLAPSVATPGTLLPFLVSGQNSSLKYNVRPIHATLQKYVWDFGVVDNNLELECIHAFFLLFSNFLLSSSSLPATFLFTPLPLLPFRHLMLKRGSTSQALHSRTESGSTSLPPSPLSPSLPSPTVPSPSPPSFF